MATVTVGHHPELTAERAMEAFKRGFAGKYEVSRGSWLARGGGDFVVKKSGWTGVAVRLRQVQGGTAFVFTGLMPSLLLRAFLGGLVAYLLLRPRWRAMEQEVASFIQSAGEFK